MLYSALTDAELHRWVRNSPRDLQAKVELTRRAMRIISEDNARVVQLQEEVYSLECHNHDLYVALYGLEDV